MGSRIQASRPRPDDKAVGRSNSEPGTALPSSVPPAHEYELQATSVDKDRTKR